MPPIDDAFKQPAEISAAHGVTTRAVTAADYPVMHALHDLVFGPGSLTRTAYRIREGLPFHTPFCRVAVRAGAIIGFVRFAPITIGGQRRALMLGPLAVHPVDAGRGHARRLIGEGLDAARTSGIRLVFLVGDVPYYGKLGFKQIPIGRIVIPGPVDPTRMLAYELEAGACDTYAGLIAGDR